MKPTGHADCGDCAGTAPKVTDPVPFALLISLAATAGIIVGILLGQNWPTDIFEDKTSPEMQALFGLIDAQTTQLEKDVDEMNERADATPVSWYDRGEITDSAITEQMRRDIEDAWNAHEKAKAQKVYEVGGSHPCPVCGKPLLSEFSVTLHLEDEHGVTRVPRATTPEVKIFAVITYPDGRVRIKQQD